MTVGILCTRCGATAGGDARFCPICGNALQASGEVSADPLLGRLRQATAGEYDVLRALGQGGMAAVYLAWDLELARAVAIKVLLPELAYSPAMAQRFLQEARTAANLDDHPSVVRVYRAREAGGLRYFVMKYVDGCSLDDLLRARGRLAPELAAHVLDQVAQALHYAHEHGVVHRDVKPGNVMLDRQGQVVVTDFGIAKIADAETLTRTGMAIGTPHYMSPEQWRIEPMSPAADQYALGCVAYHLLTGEVPFDGSQYAIQEKHLHEDPPSPRARAPEVPAAFDDAVRRMLAKVPGDRFPDLRAVSQALGEMPRASVPALRERLARLIPAAPADALTPARETGPRATPGASVPVVGQAYLRRTPVSNEGITPDPAAEGRRPPVDPGASTAAFVAGAGATASRAATGVRPSAYTPPAAPSMAPAPGSPAAPPPEAMPAVPSVAAPSPVPSAAAPARPRSRAPLVAAGALVAGLAATAVVLRGSGAESPASPAPVRAAAAAAATPAPAGAGTTGGVDAPGLSALPAETVPVPSTDSLVATAAAAPSDSGSAAPGTAAVLLIPNAPPGGRQLALAVGDSVLLRARVNDARGVRLRDAVVRWTVSDSARLALRRGWVVALAAGGPVAVTASAGGPATRTVRVVIAPRAQAVAAVERPGEAQVRAAIDELVAALRARDMSTLERRLAPQAADGSDAREFLEWVRKARGFRPGLPAAGAVAQDGATARVAVRVPLQWRGSGLLGGGSSRDVTFYVALRHGDGGWRGGEVTLAERVKP